MNRLSLIVAMANNRAIGLDNKMPWHLPADFAWFKQHTLGHPVIMGRKTFQSIGRPLPGRRNLVVSRNVDFRADGAEVVPSLERALQAVADTEPFIIGGASLYVQALPLASRLIVTEVDANLEADTFFPAWNADEWREVSREHRPPDEKNRYAMDFVVWERVKVKSFDTDKI